MSIRFIISVNVLGYRFFARNSSESYRFVIEKGDKVYLVKQGWHGW